MSNFAEKNYIDKFLNDHRDERMDANREDIFNPARCAFHKDRYEFAAKYIKDDYVLDVAAGTGYGADLMMKKGNPNKIIGVEYDPETVAYAEKNYALPGKIEFIQGSILDLPFEENTFDVLTSFETIEHVENEAKQIQEVKRVLKLDGLYIVSTPNNWDNSNNPHHVRDYDYNSITKLINDNFEMIGMFNQNSGCGGSHNRYQPRGIIETTMYNYKNAECFIIVARNTEQ